MVVSDEQVVVESIGYRYVGEGLLLLRFGNFILIFPVCGKTLFVESNKVYPAKSPTTILDDAPFILNEHAIVDVIL